MRLIPPRRRCRRPARPRWPLVRPPRGMAHGPDLGTMEVELGADCPCCGIGCYGCVIPETIFATLSGFTAPASNCFADGSYQLDYREPLVDGFLGPDMFAGEWNAWRYDNAGDGFGTCPGSSPNQFHFFFDCGSPNTNCQTQWPTDHFTIAVYSANSSGAILSRCVAFAALGGSNTCSPLNIVFSAPWYLYAATTTCGACPTAGMGTVTVTA